MNKEQLIKTLSVQSESYNQWRMFAFIVRQLKKIDCDFFVDDGCIYITKGVAETYPCIIAHMDTVHRIDTDLSILEYGKNITGFNCNTMTQTGIGGDDKVGIFIAMECLKSFDNIKVVFFRDEEVGCDGSYNAYMKFFNDCSFVLQCDRKGNKDFITNAGGIPLSSNEFIKDVKPILFGYGYKFESGLMTDVMALKENGLKISAANISCGYYNPHCRNEYVNVDDVENCLDMVKDIIILLGNTRYKHKYKPKKEKKEKYFSKGFDDMDYYGRFERASRSLFDSPRIEKPARCGCCLEEANHLTFRRDWGIELCDRCIADYLPEPALRN